MSLRIVHPAIDRMILGYAVAVLVAAYAGAFSIATWGLIFSHPSRSSGGPAITVLLSAAAILGTVVLPVVFLAGLPAFAVACWLAIWRGVRLRRWFCLLGVLGSATAAFLLLPAFHHGGRLSRDVTEPDVLTAGLTGLIVLAPAGALAGWIFGRVSFGRAA